MTGRRSTRAASSRASSIAGSDLGQATPRRSTRSHPILEGSPLPPALPSLASVPTRGSTSYGSSIAGMPVDFRRSGHGRDLTETLTDILGTVQENIQAKYGYNPNPPNDSNKTEKQAPPGSEVGSRSRGRRASSKAPSGSKALPTSNDPLANDTPAGGSGDDRAQAPSVTSTPGNNTISYLGESSLYGDATFVEDVATTPLRRGGKKAIPRTVEDEVEPAAERMSLWMQLIAWIGSLYETITSVIGTLAARSFGLLYSLARSILSRWDLLVLLLVLTFGVNLFNTSLSNTDSTKDAIFEDGAQSLGFSIGHKIRQWIPSPISSPLSYLNDLDISNLQGRMSVVENELHSIKKHIVLNREALDELKRILPEEMYLSKENGEAELPRNFWRALTQKGSRGYKDTPEPVSRSDWDDFIAQNEAKVKALQAEMSETLWAQHLQEALKDGGVLVSKADVIEMIQKRWDESEISIRRQVKDEISNVAKALKQPAGITKEEATNLFKELAVKVFAKEEDSKNVAYYSLQRPNHFSIGLGAVVNPTVTSPTYAFAKARAWWPKRLILWAVGYGIPTPNPPAEALRKWDEAGDCWCSPATGTGAGVQLGVLMAHDLFPKEFVIEHIPKSATLDWTSAPREIELLAQIDDYKAQGILGELSEKIFPNFYERHLDKNWILIGTWHYDMDEETHVQHFYPQIDLKSLGISTRQLIVRVKSNQGNPDYTCIYRARVYGDVAE